MTTTAPSVPQVLLPGQAAAPEGPVDMIMMYVMHHAFRRDLAAFAARVPTVAVDDATTWRALAQRWTDFASVLHKHHSGEDAGLWPLLLERVDAAGDAEGRATLEAMEAEHAEIDPLLEGCAAGLRRLAERVDEDTRAALAVRVCAARESLRRHLAHEETEAIAIIQRLLTAEDWTRIEEEHVGGDVPFATVVRIVPWAAYGVPREALDRVFAQAGGRGFRLVWLCTRRRFARTHARTFRYA
jgi:hemerythrin-like domain-containing protein